MRSTFGFCAIVFFLAGTHGFIAPSKVTAPRSSPPRASVHLMMIMDNPLFSVSSGVTEWLSSSLSIATEDIVEPVTYSKASYYTVLGLYLMSFPGLWSQIKRSTTAKMKRKTYISPGEKAEGGGKDLRQQAGEIMAYMKANNYEVVNAGETITFRGLVKRSTSQAFFLVFCTALGLASLALVLQIQFQDLILPGGLGQPNWFYLCLLSPYAGVYYWKAGDRVDDCEVKLASNDDDTENEITSRVVKKNLNVCGELWGGKRKV